MKVSVRNQPVRGIAHSDRLENHDRLDPRKRTVSEGHGLTGKLQLTFLKFFHTAHICTLKTYALSPSNRCQSICTPFLKMSIAADKSKQKKRNRNIETVQTLFCLTCSIRYLKSAFQMAAAQEAQQGQNLL